ncbi:MAG: tetratricopeptide repeat protein [Candidatus Hydrogenedentota bacterium]
MKFNNYIWLVIVGIGARLIFYFTTENYASLTYPSEGTDMETYNNWALEIMNGKLFQNSAFYMGPLYPYLMALIFKLIGYKIIYIQVLQYLSGIISGILIFNIMKYFVQEKIALFVSFGYMFYPFFFIFESIQLTDSLALFLNVCVIYFLIKYFSQYKKCHLILAGLFSGLSILTRGNLLIVLPFFCLFIFLSSDKSYKRSIFNILLYFTFTFLIISPATIHNYIVEKRFVLVTTNAGINLYIGNNPEATGWYTYPSFTSREPGKAALKWIIENREKFLKLTLKKARYFLLNYEIPQNLDTIEFIRNSYILSEIYKFLNFGLVLSIGLPGIIFLGLSRKSCDYVILIYLFFYSLSVILFFVTDRYRLPIVPVFFLCAGICIDKVFGYYKKKKYLEIIVILICVGFCYKFTNINPKEIREVERGSEVRAIYNEAVNLLQSGELEDAIIKFEKVVNTKKDYKNAWLKLGSAYFNNKEYDKSIECYNKVIELDKDNYDANYGMGMNYLFKNDIATAKRYFNIVYEFYPDNINNLWRLAGVEFNLGNVNRAEELCEKAIKINGKDGRIYALLGIINITKGDLDKAKEDFRLAKEYDPNGSNTKRLEELINNTEKVILQLGGGKK